MALTAVTKNLQALGNYRMAELLGHNGITATFKAFEQESELPAAIVVMHESALAEWAAWETVKRDIGQLVNSSASRLCQPFACGHNASHIWAAYEWQSGQTLLRQIAESGKPTPAEAFQWASEIADALATLHRHGGSHLSISPASIFINNYQQAKLLHACWGRLFLNLKGGLVQEDMGSIVPFLAPEVAGHGVVDEAADIYGLGACLYTMLTGEAPFDGPTLEETLHQVRQQRPKVDPLVDLIMPDGVELLEELLAKDPDDRPLNLPALSDRLAATASTLQRLSQTSPTAGAAGGLGEDQLKTHLQLQKPDVSPQASASAAPPLPQAAGQFFDKPGQQPAASQAGGAPSHEGYPQAPPMTPPTHSMPQADSLPPPPEADPQPAAPGKKRKPKNTKLLAAVAAGGLVMIVLAVLLASMVAGMLGTGGGEGGKEVEAEGPPKPPPGPAMELSASQMALYDQTANQLREIGLLARGFEKTANRWPASLEDLEELGATEAMFTDAYGKELDLRDEFVISAGPDKKWDTDDDIWFDAAQGLPGGYQPRLRQ